MNNAAPSASGGWKSSYLALTTLLMRRREELGISQEALAALLGIGRRTLQRWESGEAEPPGMRMFQWAGVLGVRIAPDVAQSGTDQSNGRAA